MPKNITWKAQSSIAGGPSTSTSQVIAIEAYDEIEVDLEDGDTDEEVEVQPGGAGQVRFLQISATAYGEDLSYKVNATGNPSHKLDRPLLLAGDGAVGLLDPAPASLFFTNNLGSGATIHVLVGRNAT
jgi:hypothetical protein